MKTILQTDFIDYYDHWFDRLIIPEPHHTFRRMSRTWTNREEALKFMDSRGIDTAPHGTIENLAERFGDHKFVVVYTDPHAHAGYGKERMILKDALKRFPGYYATLFAQVDHTYRTVQIGRYRTLLKYTSDHEWKSNVGDVQITPMGGFRKRNFDEYYPLFAIDYVPYHEHEWYAIDFNTAPLLKFTAIEELMRASDVVDEIRAWMEWKYA